MRFAVPCGENEITMFQNRLSCFPSALRENANSPRLHEPDVFGLITLAVFRAHGFKLNTLAFGHALKTGSSQCRDVKENVFGAVLRRDKPESLFCIEKFHDSLHAILMSSCRNRLVSMTSLVRDSSPNLFQGQDD